MLELPIHVCTEHSHNSTSCICQKNNQRNKILISQELFLPVWFCCFTVAALELFCWPTEDDEFAEEFEPLELLPALLAKR